MTSPKAAASSSFFRIPSFSKGDLEEVMMAMRPYDISEISKSLPDRDLPFFPFPDEDLPRNPGNTKRPEELN